MQSAVRVEAMGTPGIEGGWPAIRTERFHIAGLPAHDSDLVLDLHFGEHEVTVRGVDGDVGQSMIYRLSELVVLQFGGEFHTLLKCAPHPPQYGRTRITKHTARNRQRFSDSRQLSSELRASAYFDA